MFEFVTTSIFLESLKVLDQDIRIRIQEKIKFFSQQENPLLFAKKLKGYKDVFRFRVGDYRIVFQFSKNATFILLLVKHRKDIYKGL